MQTFEQILLKKILSSSEFFSKTVPIIKSHYFVNQGNAKLFQLVKQHYVDYNLIPTMTEIVVKIKDVPNVELKKMIVTQLQEINSTEHVQNMEFMLTETVQFVKDAIFTEALILGSDAVAEKSEEKTQRAKALMEEMSKISINTDLGLDFNNIEVMIEYYQNKLIGVLTQHVEFNKRIATGFLPGTLSVIMASSGVGKCSLKSDCINIYVKDIDLYKEKLDAIRSRKNIKTEAT